MLLHIVASCGLSLLQTDKNMRLLTGKVFKKESETHDEFWDTEEDKKFEVKM